MMVRYGIMSVGTGRIILRDSDFESISKRCEQLNKKRQGQYNLVEIDAKDSNKVLGVI